MVAANFLFGEKTLIFFILMVSYGFNVTIVEKCLSKAYCDAVFDGDLDIRAGAR
jgi:hypothetical protein